MKILFRLVLIWFSLGILMMCLDRNIQAHPPTKVPDKPKYHDYGIGSKVRLA